MGGRRQETKGSVVDMTVDDDEQLGLDTPGDSKRAMGKPVLCERCTC